MATDQGTIDYLLDQLRSSDADVSAKKMFGEYGLYLDGKMVALVCDDQLFMKAVPGTAAMLEGVESAPPYPQAKPHPRIDGDRWEDADWLAQLFRITAAELPAPKGKKARS
jgi:DNA transformation protein and related proteins